MVLISSPIEIDDYKWPFCVFILHNENRERFFIAVIFFQIGGTYWSKISSSIFKSCVYL